MELILGIDLGTTNSLVGVVDSGFPILLADENGRRLTPSAVYFAPDGSVEVGEKALRMRGVQPDRTVTSVKRLMGKDGARVRVGDANLAPEEVSAEILRHLKAVAERALETEVTKAVITVPAYFNDAERQATKRAGEAAGLEVARILNEPTAAALAYGLDKLDEKSRVAVYDLGGGTFDISILELNAGVFQVLATHGDTRLGGDDIDAALAAFLWEEAGEEGEFAAASASVGVAFVEAARLAKIALTEGDATTVRLPFYAQGRSFERELSRAEFESLVLPVIDRTRAHCRDAMRDAGLENPDLDAVVLVGGSTRIPAVRTLVEKVFGQLPNTTQHPDEAIGLGAVIQAGILSGALREMVLLDVTPLSLGIETLGGLMNVLIPRNTTIPVKRGEMFTNAVADQRAMRIRVLQGERELARDNWELGQFEIGFQPGPKGGARVGVQFEIDANGILTVLARDTATKVDKVVTIESAAVDVEDEAVEAMVSESVEHAFEDMNDRLWVEARMKAEEMLPAVDAALAAVGDGLRGDERARIGALCDQVATALATGVLADLKQATAALDEATEALAALLVEKAMDAALE